MSLISIFEDGNVRIVKVGPMGPGNNNAYLVRDTDAKETLLIDMPLEEKSLLEAIAEEGNVSRIVATHWHPDHWMTYDAVRAATQAPVFISDQEIRVPAERIDGKLADQEIFRVGSIECHVLHTPGHTPGSICLCIGKAVISGDTLFRGGPGKTFASGDLEILLRSIVDRLLPLFSDTLVLPGHGDNTTIGESKKGYETYAKAPRPIGSFGHVVWLA